MANLTLELNINSASNLKNVNYITKMNVYGVITLHGGKTHKKEKMKTVVDRSGKSNPTWDHAVKISIKEKVALKGCLTLVVKLFSKRILGDKDVGGVEVPLLDLLRSYMPSNNVNGHGMKFVTYQVKTPSEKMKGYLTYSYRFNIPPVKFGYGYHQASYGYMRPPSPPLLGHIYEGSSPQQPTRNEARLHNADIFVSLISFLFFLTYCFIN